MDGVNVDAVHAAVTTCPGVASLGSGTASSLTTYLPGRRLPGIRINPDSVELEIVASWGLSAAEIVRQIRHALTPVVDGRRVDVTIADIQLPSEAPQPAAVAPLQAAAPLHPPALPVAAVDASMAVPRLESEST